MTCIIIEDEMPAQNILKHFISKIPDMTLVQSFKAAIEANAFLNSQTVDVIFLDINLPDMSGLDYIRTLKNPPAVVMTTAYPDYAANSFELDTIIDYLVKPFSFDRFLKAVNKVKKSMSMTEVTDIQDSSDAVFLNIDKIHHKIHLNDIQYIESDRNYVTIVTADKRLCYIESLKQWKDKLQDAPFVQVHKSFIVSLQSIDKISGNVIHLNDHRIPIGRTYKHELLKKLGIL